MNKTSFSVNGNEFLFVDGGVAHKSAAGETIQILWSELHGLRKSAWRDTHYIAGAKGKFAISSLPLAEQSMFLEEFYRRWSGVNNEAAKKDAYDYLDGARNFVGLLFFVSLLFSLPISYALINDAREQHSCTLQLGADPVVAHMQVIKAVKKREGHYLLDLSFTTPEGKTILGKDQFITKDHGDPPAHMPIIYSKANPDCWSLTPSAGSSEVNWAKRRFFVAYTLLFGLFFLLSGSFSLLWCFYKWRENRPHRELVRKVFRFS